MGLRDIGGMSPEHYATIVSARESAPRNLPGLLQIIPLPKRLWQNLVESGALDNYGTRQELERCLDAHRWGTAAKNQEQCSFLDAAPPQKSNPPAQTPSSMMERLYGEFRSTGMCYSSHPMQATQSLTSRLQVTESCDLPYCSDGQKIRVAGLVVSRQTPPTRSKQRIIFLTLEDCSGLVDVAVFADAQKTGAREALGGGLLLVEGILRKTGARGISVTAHSVQRLYDVGMR
jgi:DNA polymerase III alpha subunit